MTTMVSSRDADVSKTGLIWVLGALAALGPLSIDAYLPALPAVERDLAADVGGGELTLAAFFLGLACSQLAWGPLADRYGRRKPLLVGLVMHALGSLVAMIAPTMGVLIAARFVQAIGGAAGVVLVRAIVRDTWDTEEGALVLSQLMLIMGAAPILAPTLGSFILLFAGWRAIFGMLTVAALLLVVLVLVAVPDTRPPAPSATVLARLRLVVSDPVFVRFTLVCAFSQAAFFAYLSSCSGIFMELLGMSTNTFSMLFGMNAALYIASAQLNRWVLTRFSLFQVIACAVGVMFLAAASLFVVVSTSLSLIAIEACVVVFLIALGFTVSNTIALAMDGQAARAGIASGLLGTLQYGLAGLGSAVVGLIADETAAPMAIVMLAATVLTLIAAARGYMALRARADAGVVA